MTVESEQVYTRQYGLQHGYGNFFRQVVALLIMCQVDAMK